MGNICSRSSNTDTDNFASPGHVVGAGSNSGNPTPRASVPTKTNWKSSQGRTLGDSSGGGAQAQGGAGTDEARSNAAIAAQKRAESAAAAHKGKLGSKLAADKAKTQNQTLNEASRDERAARDADQAAEARQWS